LEQYYTILGIPQDSSKNDIKKAYRKLAMIYHPDKNDNGKDAERKFIQLTEAYEILIGERKAPVRSVVQQHYQRKAHFDFRSGSYRERWENERARRRSSARQRAREQARMHFETFKKNNDAFKRSWYYKPAFYLVHAIYITGWVIGIGLIISPIVAAFYYALINGEWWRSFTCIPLMLGGILCINLSVRLKQESSPYFN
jgi:hypothetical protein